VLDGYGVGSTVDRQEDHLILPDLLDPYEVLAYKIGPGVEASAIAPPLRGPYPGFAAIARTGGQVLAGMPEPPA
jgi:hypothetical protein